MNAIKPIARRIVIAGVLASFVAICGPAASLGDTTSARSRRAHFEIRYARLDPAAVLGGREGLMPAAERDRPDQWDEAPNRRRTEPTEPPAEDRRERDADRTSDRS